MNSCINEMPGPEVAVNARAPFQPAPITIPMEASSSSAWMIAYFACLVAESMRNLAQWRVKGSAGGEKGGVGDNAESVAPPENGPKAAGEMPPIKKRAPPALCRVSVIASGGA